MKIWIGCALQGPYWDQAINPGTCPNQESNLDREWNLQPPGAWDNWATLAKRILYFSCIPDVFVCGLHFENFCSKNAVDEFEGKSLSEPLSAAVQVNCILH